jgi:hypothetical protein
MNEREKRFLYMQDLDLEGRVMAFLLDPLSVADGVVRDLGLGQRPEDGGLANGAVLRLGGALAALLSAGNIQRINKTMI